MRKLRVLSHLIKVSFLPPPLSLSLSPPPPPPPSLFHPPPPLHLHSNLILVCLLQCGISVTFITIVGKEIFGAKFPSRSVYIDIIILVTILVHSLIFSAKILAKTFLTCMLWGLVMQFMAGYLFLHCWNNLFGELLRFADREFYSVS